MQTVSFSHGGESHTVDIDDQEMEDSPFEEGSNEKAAYDQLPDEAAKTREWKTWLQNNGRVALSEARYQARKMASAAQRANQYQALDTFDYTRERKAEIRIEYGQLPSDNAKYWTNLERTDAKGNTETLRVRTLDIAIGLNALVGDGVNQISFAQYDGLPMEDKIYASQKQYRDFPNGPAGVTPWDDLRDVVPPKRPIEICKAISAAGVSLFVFALLLGGAGTGIKRFRNRVLKPTDLKVAASFDHNVQEWVLVVSWVPPAVDPADPSRDAEKYLVRLIEVGGKEREAISVTTPSWISPMLTTAKTYKIGVRSEAGDGDTSRELVSDEVLISSTTPVPTMGTPADPLAVTLSQVPLGTGAAALKVTWQASPSGSPMQWRVALSKVGANSTDQVDSVLLPGVLLPLEHTFSGNLNAGTYTASVTAVNGSNPSKPVSNPSAVKFSSIPIAAPEMPRELTEMLSRARDASSRTVVNLAWKPPATGPQLAGYTITQSKNGVEQDSVTIENQTHSTDPLDDGTYTFLVTANNAIGPSPAASKTIVVDFNKVDPSNINWDDLISQADKDAWETEKLLMNNLPQMNFWTKAISTVSTAGDGGTIAPFEDQFTLVRLYREIIDFPEEEPTAGQVQRMADILTNTQTGGHTPVDVNTPDDVWFQKAGLLSNTAGAVFSVRWQLAGLQRALENLLDYEHSIK